MDMLRIALLGSGYIGKTYAESIAKYNTRGKLAVIAGGRRAPGLAAEYGADYEATYESVLARKDVDAVLIATPHAVHKEQVIQAAEHGKHVLVEKPMATSKADCTAMIEACRKAGVMLEVIQTLRFRGTLVRAKQLIDEGKIGKIRMVRGSALFTTYVIGDKPWAALPENGGAFLDMGVHNFGILRFLTGAEAKRVYSQVTTFDARPYPGLSGMTQIHFDNGVMGQQWMSYELPSPNLPNHAHRYIVVGDKGILDIDGYGKLLLGSGDQWELIWEQPAMDYINRPMEPQRLEAFYNQTQAFIDDVLDNRPPTVSGEDGRAAVEIVEAAQRSSQTGQAVELPL
ncbi:MAG: Gfo/Idh/MocA family oxidoreductase [Chloroflexi bacterium]|nr:Gfo/Idh/MocA family oxidoreductase [Chloroflexota bacterium]